MSFITQLISLTKAATAHITSGAKHASEDEQKKRAAICDECPLLLREDYRCGSCFCYLKYKIAWETSKCPEERW